MGYFPERRHPRYDFGLLPWVFSLQVPAPAAPERPLRLEAKNISGGGMKFVCNRRFPLFEILQLSLLDKKNGKTVLTPQGKVVRVEEIDTGFGERTFGIALEFTSGNEPLASLLAATEKSSGK